MLHAARELVEARGRQGSSLKDGDAAKAVSVVYFLGRL